MTLVDKRGGVCMWRCLACGGETRSRAEPLLCECGVERSWLRVEPAAGVESGGGSVRASGVERHEVPRLRTGCAPLDRLLGGGVARGSAVLVYGKRGAGKSRLAARFAAAHECLIVHAEMALEVALHICRSTGAELERIALRPELDGWQQEAERLRVRAVVLDSLAAAEHDVGALRAAQKWAQRRAAVVYCIAHATKAGDHRGESSLAHWADYEWCVVPPSQRAKDRRVRLEVRKTRLEPGGSVRVELGAEPIKRRGSQKAAK